MLYPFITLLGHAEELLHVDCRFLIHYGQALHLFKQLRLGQGEGGHFCRPGQANGQLSGAAGVELPGDGQASPTRLYSSIYCSQAV